MNVNTRQLVKMRKLIRKTRQMLLVAVMMASLVLPTMPGVGVPTAQGADAPVLAQPAEAVFANLEAYQLDNGLQVLLVPRPNVAVTLVDVWVGVGSINETPENNGIAHFFEHMVFKGTPSRPGTVDLEVESLGGRTNAATSFDYTHYYIEVPSEHTAQAIDILADITQNASFPEEEIAKEKQVVLRERDQRRDNPQTFLATEFYQTFFQGHPYGMPIVGTEEGLDPRTREDFLAFKEQYYTPNNMTLIVAGNFDPVQIRAVIDETFGAMPSRPVERPSFPAPPPLTESRVITIEHDVNQGYLIFGWPAPSIREPEDVYAMDVLLAVLSEGRGSRFYRHIIKELGIANSVDAGYFTTRDPSTFTVSATFPYENRALVEQAIFQELRRILEGDLSEAELERAKTMLLSSLAYSHETNDGIASSLGFYSIVADDYRFALTYGDQIQAQTVENVVAVARKYIDLDRYLEMVLVPKGQAVEAPARLDEGVLTLDNGLRLILRPDNTTEVVALQTFIGGGTSVESAEEAGLAELTMRLLMRGTTSRDEETLFEEIENLGARLDYGLLPDMANLTLVATADTWSQALPIYLDVLLNPAFSEEEFLRLKDEMMREVQAQADQFGNVVFQNLLQALYGPGGYGNASATVESLRQLTLEDVREFYRRYFVPNNLVISAVGNFDAGLMRARLQGRLGTLAPGEEDLLPAPPQISLSANQTVTATRESNLTWMMVGYPAPPVASPDYPAMKVLNTILGTGFTSRLFSTLREEQALAYSTSSAYPSRRGESYLYAFIITLPENAEVAREGILQIVRDIQENGVTEEELERARNKAIGDYASAHETAERRAWYLGWYETLGVGVELDEGYPELLRAVTAEDVQRVARQYLQQYVVSQLGPAQP
ncbi:M16 family metallopeptidase [Litorilinea aerophila]|uniref:Insulinase family protein n=1 Tax=Litorilinea aerophila TaxID=1204385 RepID=A0A540V9U2_9CHLR|nr:pitrilysin family protein [Litorilinea aerophila]